MENKFKKFKNPIILGLYKFTRESNQIVKDQNGKIVNEGQEATYISLKSLEDDIRGVFQMGYKIINIVSLGDAKKEDVEEILNIIKPKPKKSDAIEILLKQNEELMARLEKVEGKKNKKEENN